jgi:hypothetical protein
MSRAEDTTSNTILAALSYHARGWNPTPVHRETKRPVIDGWQTTRLTERELAITFSDNRYNLGIVLGRLSGGLVDIDLDVPSRDGLHHTSYHRPTPVSGASGTPGQTGCTVSTRLNCRSH